MPTAFRQTATLADSSGRYRTSIILASRATDWSEAAKAEHCQREGRVNPIKALTLTDAQWHILATDSRLCHGYVDAPGDIDSEFQPESWQPCY